MAPVVATSSLGRVYGSEADRVVALGDLSISIGSGEFAAIMGTSGSGKSTLLHLLGLLDAPSTGTYLLDGEDVENLSAKRLSDLRCRKIGFVFQNFNLLSRHTALENVELPLIYAGARAADRRRRALQALEAVGVGRRAKHWPHQLSGGEQQRVAIARAIVNRPSLILADEPTGALDSQTGSAILDLFDQLNREGRTIVMVTHDAAIAHRARRIMRLSDGKLVSDGPFGPRAEPLLLRPRNGSVLQ